MTVYAILLEYLLRVKAFFLFGKLMIVYNNPKAGELHMMVRKTKGVS